MPRLTRGVALALSLAAGCAPNAPRIGPPVRLRAWCGTLEPRPTGLYSVMSSTDDRLLDESPTAAEVERAAAREDGVIAYFHAQLLALPRVSQALGESDGYARVDAVAVPCAWKAGASLNLTWRKLLARAGEGADVVADEVFEGKGDEQRKEFRREKVDVGVEDDGQDQHRRRADEDEADERADDPGEKLTAVAECGAHVAHNHERRASPDVPDDERERFERDRSRDTQERVAEKP